MVNGAKAAECVTISSLGVFHVNPRVPEAGLSVTAASVDAGCMSSENVRTMFALSGTPGCPFVGFVPMTVGAVESIAKTGLSTVVVSPLVSLAVKARRALALLSEGTVQGKVV